jgi:hypothetical protein
MYFVKIFECRNSDEGERKRKVNLSIDVFVMEHLEK